ncbi:MAG: hypothetical protein V3V08_06420 [Nannocystaceae bacterium]
MSQPRKSYDTPQLRDLGSVTATTQEGGWGLAEFFASIVSQGDVTTGPCGDSFWNPADCFS